MYHNVHKNFTFLLVLTGVLFNVFVNDCTFWFAGTICVASLLILFQTSKKIQIRIVDILFITLALFICINYICLNGHPNMHCCLSLLMIPLYVVVRMVANDEIIRRWCFIALLAVVLAQAVLGLLQLYGFAHSYHNLYRITGTFSNPGLYAGLIAVGAPLALGYSFEKFLTRWERWMGLTTLLACMLVLPATMSRAAWIAAAVGCFPVIWEWFKDSRLKFKTSGSKLVSSVAGRITIITVISVLILFSFAGIYLIKKDSADGRRVIWRASMELVKKRPIFGAGYGRFAAVYGDAQATYFLEKERPANQIMVADSPEYAFNEYVQIAVELGFVGLALFLLLTGSCFTNPLTLTTNHYALIAILIFAAFSYPFSVLPLCIVFVFLLALSAPSSRKLTVTIPVWMKAVVVALCWSITAYSAIQILPKRAAYREWSSLQKLYQLTAYNVVAKDYAELYPKLRHEKNFLFEYGQCLSKTEQYAESNRIFEEYLHYGSDPMVYNCMGNNFKGMSEYAQAESMYIRASQVVPNRHYPLYLLMKLYQEIEEAGEMEKKGEEGKKAKAMAEILLQKPVKVPSTAIREMHEEAKKVINE